MKAVFEEPQHGMTLVADSPWQRGGGIAGDPNAD